MTHFTEEQLSSRAQDTDSIAKRVLNEMMCDAQITDNWRDAIILQAALNKIEKIEKSQPLPF